MNDILFVGEHSRTFEVQWHSHEHWELVYCTGGVGVFQLDNGVQVNYRAGEVVAIPPGERHANHSQEGFTNIHTRETFHDFKKVSSLHPLLYKLVCSASSKAPVVGPK